MNIFVLGAGAMGSFFGGRLADSGYAVTLLDVNDAYLDAIRRDGLALCVDGVERIVANLSVARPENAEGVPDLLIVFTKSMHTRAALSTVRRVLGPDTVVLTLQNGLGNLEIIEEFVPKERVLVGMTTWPADMDAPGRVSSHGAGKIRMMSADGVRRPELEQVAHALNQAGLGCAVDDDVWVAIWEKVAFNAALNSLCAITGCAVEQLDLVPGGRRLALAIVAESIAVARAHGVDADPTRCSATVLDAIERHHGHKPSMLQDMLASRPSEIETINGAVVAAAERVGIAVPYTDTLLQLVRLVEARRPGDA